MSRVFISFLGTGNYLECNYYYKSIDNKVDNVKFVQEAMLKIFCNDFNENDKVIIFMTEDSKSTHWDSLKNRISWVKAKIHEIVIPFGKSEEEIWEIFDKLYNSIEEGDEVILDVTHSFRSLPMLALVFLNYSKSMKQINVKGIYYGAFETLGTRKEVEAKDIKDRNAPIFDLTPFHSLQQWSIAADNFLSFGNPLKLINLLKNELDEQTLISNKAKNILTSELLPVVEDIWDFISTVRGKKIIQGDRFEKLNKEFINLERKLKRKTPAEKLLFKVKEHFEGYKKDSLHNGLYAINFCLEHDLIQQGVTLARELFVSFVEDELNIDDNRLKEYLKKDIDDKKINLRKEFRELVAGYTQLLAENKISVFNTGCFSDKISTLLSNSNTIKTFNKEFSNLAKIRNSINHAGITDNINSKQIKEVLSEFYKNVLLKIKED